MKEFDLTAAQLSIGKEINEKYGITLHAYEKYNSENGVTDITLVSKLSTGGVLGSVKAENASPSEERIRPALEFLVLEARQSMGEIID